MLEKNGCVQTHYIDGVNPSNLKYVEIIDLYDNGEIRWFIKDSFDNTTPVFDNEHEFITINDKSCMFLGRYNGNTKLFIAKTSKEENNQTLYEEIELEGNPKKLINVDSKYLIVRSEKGVYYFDKETLKRSSDIFDRINTSIVDGEVVSTFEKEITNENRNISKNITGTVTSNGKIGNIIYDDSINCLRTAPKININDSYDLLNTVELEKELDELYIKRKQEKHEYVKRLTKMNKR